MNIASMVTALGDGLQTAVDAWLDLGNTTGGAAIHIASLLTGVAVVNTLNPLVYVPGKTLDGQSLSSQIEWLMQANAVADTAAGFANKIFCLFMMPSIEGIPIIATSEQGNRRADVSEDPLIVQSTFGTTSYITDSTTPHPREWTLTGHIMSMTTLDHYFVFKQSIAAQKAFLDMCMVSRRPVWLKTYDNIYTRVLITNFQWSWDPRYMNALSVTLQVKEYVPYEVTDGIASAISAGIKALGVTV